MLTVMCLLGALLCYAEAMPVWLIFSISPILLSLAVNHLDNLPRVLTRVLSLRPLRYLGIYSYSIYIWQQFYFEYAWAFPIPKIALALVAVVVGALSFYCLENPARQLINSRWSKILTTL